MEKRHHISLRLKPEMYQTIKALADASRRPITNEIMVAIDQYLLFHTRERQEKQR